MNDSQLALSGGPQLITSLDDMDRVAKSISGSGMFGITKPEQAITLMLICQAEGLNPIAALRRYHIIEGKPSMRADAMHGEFEARGSRVIWYVRTDDVVAGTAFKKGVEIDDAARDRGTKRFEMLWKLEYEQDPNKRGALMIELAKLSREGEETLIRSYADAEAKGLTEGKNGVKANWSTSPRQMLTARFITEIVRLLDPGLIAGIISDIEAQDIARQHSAEAARLTNAAEIDQSDVPAILGIIAQHDAELATDIPDGRRKTVQGLRMDLVCKLADIGVKPPTEPDAPKPTVGGIEAKTVDTVVLPPDQAATAKQPATRRQRTAATTANAAPADDIDQTPRAAEQGMYTPWREFICLRGQSPGMMHGHTLESIFLGKMKPDTELKLEKLVGWFTAQAIPTSSDPHDKALWHHVQEAQAELRAGFALGTPATPASTPTTPAAQKPAQQAAKATDWREFVIPGRHPDFAGKTLGSLGTEGLKRLQDEYLVQIEWSKATLPQKSLKAHVAMAMAELFPKAEDLSPAASEAAFDHVKALTDILTANKWDAGFFITQCKLNAWIAEEVRSIGDISAEEYAGLEQGWPTVEEEMAKAHQPAKHP